MNVGESFAADLVETQNIRSAAHKWKSLLGRKFLVRKSATEVRCWRVE